MLEEVPPLLRPIPPDDFLDAHRILRDTYEREGGQRSIQRTMRILREHFGRKDIVIPMMMRMKSLAELYQDPRMRPWTIESGEGTMMVVGPVLRAVA